MAKKIIMVTMAISGASAAPALGGYDMVPLLYPLICMPPHLNGIDPITHAYVSRSRGISCICPP